MDTITLGNIIDSNGPTLGMKCKKRDEYANRLEKRDTQVCDDRHGGNDDDDGVPVE